MHPAALDPDRLLGDCDVRSQRASGPGGQRRNKVETAVRLRHRPTGVEAGASERRSRAENLRVALFRLRVNLALAVRTPRDAKAAAAQDGQAGTLWRSRCRAGRIVLNPEHADFPAMLSEALDVITGCRYDVAAAAAVLQCTASQLVKLLRHEPRALARVNSERQQLGLHPLA